MTLSPAKVNVVYFMVVRALLQKKWKRVLDILFHRTEEIRIEISREEAELKRLAKEQSDRIVEIIKESWRFWVIAIVLFYFFISIASSALIGEWDALRGGRFMVGDWHIPEVSLYSTSSIPALKNYEITLGSRFEYKPLGLLASDEKVYYLVDWKTTEYYTNKPQVYVVPRSDDLILNLIVSPFGYQTPTPTVTTTPSLTPAAATPTP
jgi:hypothetical protein